MIGILGSNGFIGRHLAAYLRHEGVPVRTLSRQPGADKTIKPTQSMTATDWEDVLEGLAAVVHLANPAHSHLQESVYRAETLAPLPALLEGLERAGVKRLVYLSSIKAQGGAGSLDILTEDMPPEPEDAYGTIKLDAEKRLLSFTGTVVLRPTLVYGEGVKGNLAKLQKLAGLPIPLPFSGLNAKRAMVHVDNLAQAIYLATHSPQMTGETYLVADDAAYSTSDILRHLRNRAGQSGRLFACPDAALKMVFGIMGQKEAWARLSQPLWVSNAKLKAAGWKSEKSLFDW